MSKKNKYLIIITAILTFLYILSFTKSCSSKDSREKIKSALVNQKYRESISFITLADSRETIELNNYKGFWTLQRVSDYTSSQIQTIPSMTVSQERMENFLNELTKIRNLYKISDKINKNSSLGLNNGTEFHITYAISDTEGDTEGFHELIFGNQDFSLSSRYLMTGQNTQVYEIDNSLDTYLTSSIQSWAEPYLISHILTANTEIQNNSLIYSDSNTGKRISGKISDTEKLMELRHGGIPDLEEITALYQQDIVIIKAPEMTINLEMGDKSQIILNINKSLKDDNTYLVETRYYRQNPHDPSAVIIKSSSASIEQDSLYYTSFSKISEWTYNKIKEITL